MDGPYSNLRFGRRFSGESHNSMSEIELDGFFPASLYSNKYKTAKSKDYRVDVLYIPPDPLTQVKKGLSTIPDDFDAATKSFRDSDTQTDEHILNIQLGTIGDDCSTRTNHLPFDINVTKVPSKTNPNDIIVDYSFSKSKEITLDSALLRSFSGECSVPVLSSALTVQAKDIKLSLHFDERERGTKSVQFRRRSVPEMNDTWLSLSDRAVAFSGSWSSRSTLDRERNMGGDAKEDSKPEDTRPIQAPLNDDQTLDFENRRLIPLFAFTQNYHEMDEESIKKSDVTDHLLVITKDKDEGKEYSDENTHPNGRIRNRKIIAPPGIKKPRILVGSQEGSQLMVQSNRKMSRWDHIEAKSSPPQPLDNNYHESKVAKETGSNIPNSHEQRNGNTYQSAHNTNAIEKNQHTKDPNMVVGTKLHSIVESIHDHNRESDEIFDQKDCGEISSTSLHPNPPNTEKEHTSSNEEPTKLANVFPLTIPMSTDMISFERFHQSNIEDADQSPKPRWWRSKRQNPMSIRTINEKQDHKLGVSFHNTQKSLDPETKLQSTALIKSANDQRNRDDTDYLFQTALCISRPVTRYLFCIPEDNSVGSNPEKYPAVMIGNVRTDGQSGSCTTLDVFQKRRRRRLKKRQQLSFAQARKVYAASSLYVNKKLHHITETASSFLRVARLHVENRRYLDGYLQYVDALQFCIKQGVPKSNPTMIEINEEMKTMKDQLIVISPKLCDEILMVLDNRAEYEVRKEATINQAIITLKIALELRKAILENVLLSLGAQKTGIKEKFLQHVPDKVICTTSRSLLMLSRCFYHTGKVKCAHRARIDAEILFRTNRLVL